MARFDYAGDVTLSFQVRDRKAAQAWYAARLGFELLYDAPDIAWCEMRTPLPGVTVGFGDAEAVKQGGGVTPVFGVTDIAAARAALEAEGVRFDGETQHIEGMVKLATFFDPDGNAWMLAQSLMAGGD
jgi:predicted enzyme related to lactoylglutathione lyase